LAGRQTTSGIQFNVAHCEAVALYALTLQNRMGVDVELLREIAAAADMAKRFFAPEEIAALQRVPEGLRADRFLTCWTRKEAFIKAQGSGLSVPLDEFVVGVDPFDGPGVITFRGDPEETSRWSVYDLRPEPHILAALAVATRDVQLDCWSWN
jgi:4'-phosphopantetheinyl transferase